MQLYRYVGPSHIADRISQPAGFAIHKPDDVRAWMRDSSQNLLAGYIIATFVVDATGVLLLADRRSEHVACSGGRAVRSAGEITFTVDEEIEVTAVSNQSTGYCPEPESWPLMAQALVAAGLTPPFGFSPAFVFRRCVECDWLALIKDGVFVCEVCHSDLPILYNCQPA